VQVRWRNRLMSVRHSFGHPVNFIHDSPLYTGSKRPRQVSPPGSLTLVSSPRPPVIHG
jgi:hypothetical protein